MRGVHIAIAVFVIAAGILTMYIFSSGSESGVSARSAGDDFLNEVRRSAEVNPELGEVEGTIPGLSENPDMVPRVEVGGTPIELGPIPNDDYYTTEVPIYNRGERTLVIEQITTECVCTEGSMEGRTRIPPGGQAPLKLVINPNVIPGFKTTKALTIRTNDPGNRVVHLPVTTKVDPEFSLTPEYPDFGEVAAGAEHTTVLRFRTLQEEPIEVTGVKKLGNQTNDFGASFAVAPEDSWQEPGKPEYDITVTLRPTAPVGPFTQYIEIESTCKRVPSYRGAVRAVVSTGAVSNVPNSPSAE